MVLALRVSAAVLLFYVVVIPIGVWRGGVEVLPTAVIAAAMQVVGYGLLTLLAVRVWNMIRGRHNVMKYLLIGIVVVLVLMSGFVFGAVNGRISGGTATGVVEVATQTP